MINNKGMGRFELLTIIVVLLGIVAYILYTILGIGDNDYNKFKNFKSQAIKFSSTTSSNKDSFRSDRVVYLQEVIDEGFLKGVDSPFSNNTCDVNESKVEFIDNLPYVTLKCDGYLIESNSFSKERDPKIYKVGEWTTEKPKGEFETKTLYNCTSNNKNLYTSYMEEMYLLYKINSDNETEFMNTNQISSICTIVSKDFYRTKEDATAKS